MTRPTEDEQRQGRLQRLYGGEANLFAVSIGGADAGVGAELIPVSHASVTVF